MKKKELLEYLLPYDEDADVDFVIHRREDLMEVMPRIVACRGSKDIEMGYSHVMIELG